jgi:hypothetical protein
MNKTIRVLVGAGAVAMLSACNGWPDTKPYHQAVNQPEKYPTYSASSGHPVEFYAGQHRFMVMPGEVDLRTAKTAPVSAGAAGVSVFALEGDEAPYASLYARSADGRTHAVGPID